MNICLWSGSSFESSYASYHLMEEIILAMLDSGHTVYLIQMKRSDGALPDRLKMNEHLHVINIPWINLEKTNFIKRYIRQIEYYRESAKKLKEIPNLKAVFVQSNNVAIIPIRAAKKLGVPVLYNVQDIFPIDALAVGMMNKRHPAFIVSRWMQAQAYKTADRVVTISEDLATTIKGEGCSNVDVIYNWSYQNEPYYIPDRKNHFLNIYEIKREDGFRVVYAGNIGKMMNVEMMVQVAICLKDYKDIKFYIIGSGSNLKYLQQRVEKEKLYNMLFYPPQPMEYAPDNYCMADVNINLVPKGVMYTCMPSKTNTCLLSQKPTVVSMDIDSDIAKRLNKVDQWTVVPPNDADAMAKAILEYYQNIDWRRGEVKKSVDAGVFMSKLGPVENAYFYVKILEEIAEK